MTDAQFEDLRAGQLAQLAVLQSIDDNLRTLTISTLTAQTPPGSVQGARTVRPDVPNAKQLIESARKALRTP